MVVMILTGCTTLRAQDVSTEVIPSEEELLDALSSGEIDYDTYSLLLDLLLNGEDSLRIRLFDLLPSSADYRESQIHDFGKAATFGRYMRSFLSYKFGGELEDAGRTKYRFFGRCRFDSRWVGEIGLAREYSGRERFVRRSISYTDHHPRVDTRVTVGNYRARFGLGTVVGYRTKLVGYSDNVDGESFLFPDFGGFNGGLLELYFNRYHINALWSIQRDSMHSVSTFAASLMTSPHASRVGILVSGNLIRNRITDSIAQVYQIGGYVRQGVYTSLIEAEYSLQEGEAKAGALVVEARKKWSVVSVVASGWSYGQDYLGLSAGSKAASLSRTVEIDDVQFDFSDKQSGQTGGRVQSTMQFVDSWSLNGDMLFARRGDDTATLQGLVGLKHDLGKKHDVTTDFLYKSTVRKSSSENTQRRGKIDWRGDWTRVRARAAIGFTNETTYGEYWSLLVQGLLGKSGRERWRVWSNWRRVMHGRIDAWHGFVSVTEDLAKNVRGSVKFTDSYSRTSTPRHSPTIGFEMQVQL